MSEPLVMASLTYSGKAQTATVGLRVRREEVAMDARSAVELAIKLVTLAAEAEIETALVDFLRVKGGLGGDATMSPEAARIFVGLFRQHRTDLRDAEVGGRMMQPPNA